MPAPHFERRVWWHALLILLPGLVVGLTLLLLSEIKGWLFWVLLATVSLLPLCCAWALVRRIRFPLRTLSNQIAGMREGDYSIRVRGEQSGDALGELVRELNALGNRLRDHRLESIESAALLQTVIEEINVSVFAFDQDHRLKLVNKAGEQLLDRTSSQLIGRSAESIGLVGCLSDSPARILETTFGGRMGRWGMRRSAFREDGQPHQLVVITDLSRTLREEERQAWKRLVRVLGHELNNSLAPIRSLSESMEKLLQREPRPEDWEKDLCSGLGIIQSRAASLSRFMEAYARLARLPQPKLREVKVDEWVRRVVKLEPRVTVAVQPGAEVAIRADPDQLDQLLINLVRNAADAALSKHEPAEVEITVSWQRRVDQLLVWIRDNGPGLPESANLFVPFFTTKSEGSGIGLALSRQIAEAHNGSLTLHDRQDAAGSEAIIQLPVADKEEQLLGG